MQCKSRCKIRRTIRPSSKKRKAAKPSSSRRCRTTCPKTSWKTLQKSGQLAASLTTQVSSNYALIGSNKKYAAIHHLGGQAGRGHKTNLPERPYLPINGNNQPQPDAKRRILDIAIAALKKGL